ncbi:MAG: DEAD/DEAH box helicase [Planctomycetia bacterium]|nr:DEAD/DEAH box helicase [Planctomycetia bacterium]
MASETNEKTTQYAAGMRVMIRDEEWMIRSVHTESLQYIDEQNRECVRQYEALTCLGLSGMVKNRTAVFLTDIDTPTPVDPKSTRLVPDDSSNFRRARLFLESQWRRVIPTDAKIHVAHSAAMDELPYQFVPAARALRRPRQRILIADAVGLGKTLEAGALLSELIARGKGRRILVLTVKSMTAQFQRELWNRFAIPLVRLDSERISRIARELPSSYNPFNYYDKTIVSIDTLKRDERYRVYLENAYWDVIVIDEAQNVAQRSRHAAQRAKLAQLLASRSDSMIMLSATPHDGRAESFASLMNILEPTAIANPTDYGPEQIADLCVRRFKKDVKDQIAASSQERVVSIQEFQASEEEETAYETLQALELNMDAKRKGLKNRGFLFQTSLAKAMFSSPFACLSAINARLDRIQKREDSASQQDRDELRELRVDVLRIVGGNAPAELLDDRVDTQKLIHSNLGKQLNLEHFTRYQALLELLNSKSYGWTRAKDDRVVIFTESIPTMKFLACALRADLRLDPDEICTISGSDSDTRQFEIIGDFGNGNSKLRVLIASDVASEGLNLHYQCHRLIHFDVPWSLMVFQQRNGRIDRYGQTQKPDIRFMFQTCKCEKIHKDSRILKILIAKEEKAYKNIGDPSLIMGKFNQEGEELVVARAMEENVEPETLDAALDRAPEVEDDIFDILDLNPGAELEDDAAESPEESFALDAEEDDAAVDSNAHGASLRQVDRTEDIMRQSQALRQDDVPEFAKESTLMGDCLYLQKALQTINSTIITQDEKKIQSELDEDGTLHVTITPELSRRVVQLLPEEAQVNDKEDSMLHLVEDKVKMLESIRQSVNTSHNKFNWPKFQYLWRLHPIFDWVNEKCSLLFNRGEAPILTLAQKLAPGELYFIVAGTIANRRSIPMIDRLFALRYMNGQFAQAQDFAQVAKSLGLNEENLPNIGAASNEAIARAQALLPEAIDRTTALLTAEAQDYNKRIQSQISVEVKKIERLAQERDQWWDKLSKQGKDDKLLREFAFVEGLYQDLEKYVNETMTIDASSPYVRVIAALQGN